MNSKSIEQFIYAKEIMEDIKKDINTLLHISIWYKK